MKKITRRALLASTAAAIAVADQAKAGVFPRGGGIGSAPLPALTATLTFPGGTPAGGPFVFDIATGTDMGSYTNPSNTFTQRCIRVRNAGISNFFVDFRPDTTGGRIEVVFWYGECFGSVPSNHTPSNLASYTAVVALSGTPVADFMSVSTRTIPYHYWGSRWRFRTVQNRTILRTGSQVFSDGFLPPMSLTAARLSGNNTSTGQPWSGLPYSNVPSGGFVIQQAAPPLLTSSNMGTIGASTPYNTNSNGPIYEPFMQATGSGFLVGALIGQDTGGAKNEEGPISAWAFDYLFNGTASSLNTILQQAECCGGQMNSWYLPDSTTGACPYAKTGLTQYKSGSDNNILPDSSWYYIPANGTPAPNTIRASNADSHSETWFYIPYALTEDPYFIEGIQYQQMYGVFYDVFSRNGDGSANVGNIIGDPTGQSGLNGPYTVWSYPAETRNLGWGIKNIANAWMMSPTSPPSWLLSKANYAAYSSDYCVVGKKLLIDSTDKMHTVFNYYLPVFPPTAGAGTGAWADYYQDFEQSYTIMACALATFIGLPTPTVPGQITPPGWGAHAQFALGMLVSQFIATNPTDQFSIAGWNRQVPLIHDLAGTMFSSAFGVDASSNCPTSTTTSTVPGLLSPQSPAADTSYGCVATWAAAWSLYGPCQASTATFPTAAFPGNQQNASMANVNWQYAAAQMCHSAGVDTANAAAIVAYISNFIDYNWPNNADAQLGIAFYSKAGFDGT